MLHPTTCVALVLEKAPKGPWVLVPWSSSSSAQPKLKSSPWAPDRRTKRYDEEKTWVYPGGQPTAVHRKAFTRPAQCVPFPHTSLCHHPEYVWVVSIQGEICPPRQSCCLGFVKSSRWITLFRKSIMSQAQRVNSNCTDLRWTLSPKIIEGCHLHWVISVLGAINQSESFVMKVSMIWCAHLSRKKINKNITHKAILKNKHLSTSLNTPTCLFFVCQNISGENTRTCANLSRYCRN